MFLSFCISCCTTALPVKLAKKSTASFHIKMEPLNEVNLFFIIDYSQYKIHIFFT